MYDIAIIGLGPAGAALARLLAGKYRVAAIDLKGQGVFEKPCGGPSTILGFLTMLLFKPRSWCVYCPMGTMTQLICKARNVTSSQKS